MTNSIRNVCVDKLKTVLAGINGTSDYNYSITGGVHRYSVNPIPNADVPVNYIHENREDYTYMTIPHINRRLLVTLEVWLETDEEAVGIAKASANILADLERAIQTNTTLDGNAIDINFIGNEVFASQDRLPRCGVLFDVEIVYRTRDTSPSDLV